MQPSPHKDPWHAYATPARVGACKLKLHLSRPSLQTQVASLKVQLANSRRISQGLAYKRIRHLPIHWLKQELRVSLLRHWMLHSMHQTCRAKGHETASMIKTPVRASCDHTSDAATSGRTGERRATQRAWAWACPASPQGAVAKAMPERHIGGLALFPSRFGRAPRTSRSSASLTCRRAPPNKISAISMPELPLQHTELSPHHLAKGGMRKQARRKADGDATSLLSGSRATTRNTSEVVKSLMLFSSWYSGGEIFCKASNLKATQPKQL